MTTGWRSIETVPDDAMANSHREGRPVDLWVVDVQLTRAYRRIPDCLHERGNNARGWYDAKTGAFVLMDNDPRVKATHWMRVDPPETGQ